MTNILIINTPSLANRGGMAVVMGALKNLQLNMPQANTTVLCHHLQEWDALKSICQKYNAEIARHPWFRERNTMLSSLLLSLFPAFNTFFKCVWGNVSRRLGFHPRGVLHEADIILDLNIDSLNDNYGPFYPLWTLANILMGKFAGKPVVVWAAGIGQFDRRLTRVLTRIILNKVDMILPREEVSRAYLQKIGVNRPQIHVTADHAFYLEPATQERVDEILSNEGIKAGHYPLIGISPSQVIHRLNAFSGAYSLEEKYNHNLRILINIIDYIVKDMNLNVLIIPHVTNDRIIACKAYEGVTHKDRVKVISCDYTADEFKGIIGRCDMFIGYRMHPTIGATSMGVPSVAVIYGQKWYGIIGDMMGQRDYMLDIGKTSPEKFTAEFKSIIDDVWNKRISIRKDLEIRAQVAKKACLLNVSLLQNIISNK